MSLRKSRSGWLLTRPAVISLYTAQTKATLLQKYSNIVFMNSVTSLRIIIAYLLMALKKVTELLLLLSTETTLNVFDCLMQQAFSELNYMPFYTCYRCRPALKRKEFCNFSDSMSSLQSINGFNLDSDLVQKFLAVSMGLLRRKQIARY